MFKFINRTGSEQVMVTGDLIAESSNGLSRKYFISGFNCNLELK